MSSAPAMEQQAEAILAGQLFPHLLVPARNDYGYATGRPYVYVQLPPSLSTLEYLFAGVQVVFGAAEILGGVALSIGTGGIFALLGGGLLVLNGLDNVIAGTRTLSSGQSASTFLETAVQEATLAAGGSEQLATGIYIGTQLIFGLGLGIAQARQLRQGAIKNLQVRGAFTSEEYRRLNIFHRMAREGLWRSQNMNSRRRLLGHLFLTESEHQVRNAAVVMEAAHAGEQLDQIIQRLAAELGITGQFVVGRQIRVTFDASGDTIGFSLLRTAGREPHRIGLDPAFFRQAERIAHGIPHGVSFEDAMKAVLTHEYNELVHLAQGYERTQAHLLSLSSSITNKAGLDLSDEVLQILRSVRRSQLG